MIQFVRWGDNVIGAEHDGEYFAIHLDDDGTVRMACKDKEKGAAFSSLLKTIMPDFDETIQLIAEYVLDPATPGIVEIAA